MNRKPIGPTLHGVIDYGFVHPASTGPESVPPERPGTDALLHLCRYPGVINTFTDHPVGLKPIILWRVHG
jgi:hypothetical protein